MDDAKACARAMMMRWIRAVFRETSVQMLKTRWQVGPQQEHSTSAITTLTVSKEDLIACEEACQRLGTLWMQRLREAGKPHVEEWVREVLAVGRFWESSEEQQAAADAASKQAVSSEANEPTADRSNASPTSLPVSDAFLPLTRIKRLGEDYLASSASTTRPPTESWVQTLDELGRRRQSHWPLEWNVIEQAALSNKKRLHLETIKGRPRNLVPKAEFEVVPKSLVDPQEHSQLRATEIVLSHKTGMKTLMERKRKATMALTQLRPSKQTKTEEEILPVARVPSNIGLAERLPWQEIMKSLSASARDELERTMLHPDQDEGQHEEPRHVLVGALKPVGRYHMFLTPERWKNADGDGWTDKQRRRYQQRAMKERIAPHDVLKEDREDKRAKNTPWTKVMRTAHPIEQRQFLEMDVGECLLEVWEGDEDAPVLCAFSSVELTLCDESNGLDNAATESTEGHRSFGS